MNFKGRGSVIPCSLEEEPDVDTPVSSDHTPVRSVRSLRGSSSPAGGTADSQGCCDDDSKHCSRGTTATSPTGPWPARQSADRAEGPRPFPRPPPRPGRQRPAPSRPRHVTRHAPAARGLHQNKNRGGGTGGGARAGSAALAPGARPPRPRASARPGAGGQRAPPCLPPGSGPAPETVSRERARECAPTRGAALRGRRAASAAACHPRHDLGATHFAPKPSAPALLRTPPPHVAASSLTRRSERTRALGKPVPTPPRTSPSSDHPTHTFRPGRAREGVDGSKLSGAYSVPHDEARPRPRHSRSSLAAS